MSASAEPSDPLSALAGRAPAVGGAKPGAPQQPSDFQAQLSQAADPEQVLATWCVEGRPRITAALADEGSLFKLAAQLLCDSASKSFGASAVDKSAVEVRMLRAAFHHRQGHYKDAAREFRHIATSTDVPSRWRRRAYAALGWVCAASGDYGTCVRSALLEGQVCSELEEEDQFAFLLASSRIRVEIGDAFGARGDFELARTNFQHVKHNPIDCRIPLAEARVAFAEGDLDNAARIWHTQASARSFVPPIPPVADEPLASWLTAFAVAAVVGDLGDLIPEGSRWACHEAANNFAVCALHAGRLDGAVLALEEVLRSFGAPAVVDSVAACNLRTLYELCRTPENMRLLS